MELTLVPIGYGNVVVGERIVAVIAPDSAPVKRLREEARSAGKLVDATHGRLVRAILITDSDHVILSALQPETIAQRFAPDAPEAPAEDGRAKRRK
jgi:extracellular matrix regulatory protein A